MKVRVHKWGNSLALRIPRSYAVETNIDDGTTVDISVSRSGLTVRPIKTAHRLDELLDQITPENLHAEVDAGPAKGNESW